MNDRHRQDVFTSPSAFAVSWLVGVVFFAATLSSSAGFGQSLPAQQQPAQYFQHPPLRYFGPDPVANQFISADVLGPSQLLPPDLPPSEYLAPDHSLPGASIDSFLPPPAPHLDATMTDLYQADPAISEHKQGFFQKLGLTGTWIDRNDKVDDYGITEVDLLATFAVPLPTRDWPLLMTPSFKSRFLDGPGHIDLPPQLYEASFEFLWVPRFSQRWTAILGAAPGVYSDFEMDDSDALRWTGTGLVRFDWTPDQLQVIFGVLYLNRTDIQVLPAGGLIWTPNDDRRYELIFPRPKIARRIAIGPDFEDWLYLGGEFGGNSYSIERASGMVDVITLRDFRSYVGLERQKDGGAGYRLEIGYVTGRVIEFESATPDVEADSTAMIRGGITF